jgi:arginine/lysine/ornithine decarboxylase
MLAKMQGRVRMHMPGHKGDAPPGFGDVFAWDVTELPATDDLFAPKRAIARAEKLAAASACAGHTLLLTGGATAGVLAMVLSAVPPGGALILPRDCHHSALSACVLADARPVFVQPRRHGGLLYTAAEDVETALRGCPDATAVLLTRPDYKGVCADAARVAQAAHAAGAVLLVDEAHGAHLNWTDVIPNAGACGADMWVQSAHKTLPALTGAAWLHVRDPRGADRARAMLRLVHTSSPSFPILASLDSARAYMDGPGTQALAALYAAAADFWSALGQRRPGLRNAHTNLRQIPGLCCDAARLVIDPTAMGYTGSELRAILSNEDIDVEMADARHTVLIPSVSDPPGALDRVLRQLCALPAKPPLTLSEPSAGERAPETVMGVRKAALAPARWVSLPRAAGRVAAACAGAYPPGIPLVVPGERISQETVRALAQSPQCFGVRRGSLRCVASL